jgi:hypothetical protein
MRLLVVFAAPRDLQAQRILRRPRKRLRKDPLIFLSRESLSWSFFREHEGRCLPARDSLISPNAMASLIEAKPDSDMAAVAFTTGSIAPRSVRFCKASATPLISTSRMCVGKPLSATRERDSSGEALRLTSSNSRCELSIIQGYREIVLPLKSQRLLGSSLRASRKNECVNCAWGIRAGGSSKIRGTDIKN